MAQAYPNELMYKMAQKRKEIAEKQRKTEKMLDSLVNKDRGWWRLMYYYGRTMEQIASSWLTLP